MNLLMKEATWVQSNFKRSLSLGQKFEDMFCNIMSSCHPGLVFAKYRGKDLERLRDNDAIGYIGDKRIKYEIKSDTESFNTGNYYLEFTHGKKHSGPYSSNADYFVVYSHSKFWGIKREDLIFLLATGYKQKLKTIDEVRPLRYVHGGDWPNRTRGFLIDYKTMTKMFKVRDFSKIGGGV